MPSRINTAIVSSNIPPITSGTEIIIQSRRYGFTDMGLATGLVLVSGIISISLSIEYHQQIPCLRVVMLPKLVGTSLA